MGKVGIRPTNGDASRRGAANVRFTLRPTGRGRIPRKRSLLFDIGHRTSDSGRRMNPPCAQRTCAMARRTDGSSHPVNSKFATAFGGEMRIFFNYTVLTCGGCVSFLKLEKGKM